MYKLKIIENSLSDTNFSTSSINISSLGSKQHNFSTSMIFVLVTSTNEYHRNNILVNLNLKNPRNCRYFSHKLERFHPNASYFCNSSTCKQVLLIYLLLNFTPMKYHRNFEIMIILVIYEDDV